MCGTRRLHQREFYYWNKMIEEMKWRSRVWTQGLVREFIEQISRISTIKAGFQSGLILLSYWFICSNYEPYFTYTVLKQTSEKIIQFVYNLGKIKTSGKLKKAREEIIRWFFGRRFPRYRGKRRLGKRRLGMIQKSSILPSDV